jgi:hypothetical protein
MNRKGTFLTEYSKANKSPPTLQKNPSRPSETTKQPPKDSTTHHSPICFFIATALARKAKGTDRCEQREISCSMRSDALVVPGPDERSSICLVQTSGSSHLSLIKRRSICLCAKCLNGCPCRGKSTDHPLNYLSKTISGGDRRSFTSMHLIPPNKKVRASMIEQGTTSSRDTDYAFAVL